jgi:hypothetical protein
VGTLANREVQIERKSFFAALRENPSGRFLRVTEMAGDRTNTIIIPASGLREFSKMLGDMLQAAERTPPMHSAADGRAHPDDLGNGEMHPAEPAVISPA